MNKKISRGLVIAGFGAIGKSYIGQRYANIIDLESGDFAHINSEAIHIPIEKRKGTTSRPPHPKWPENYYQAIQDARKTYDIVLTSMHWDLLRFYENNHIPYYLVFPEEGLEQEYAQRCYNRGNNEQFTETMINNIKLWRKKLIDYHPQKLIILKSGQYLYDILINEGLIDESN